MDVIHLETRFVSLFHFYFPLCAVFPFIATYLFTVVLLLCCCMIHRFAYDCVCVPLLCFVGFASICILVSSVFVSLLLCKSVGVGFGFYIMAGLANLYLISFFPSIDMYLFVNILFSWCYCYDSLFLLMVVFACRGCVFEFFFILFIFALFSSEWGFGCEMHRRVCNAWPRYEFSVVSSRRRLSREHGGEQSVRGAFRVLCLGFAFSTPWRRRRTGGRVASPAHPSWSCHRRAWPNCAQTETAPLQGEEC